MGTAVHGTTVTEMDGMIPRCCVDLFDSIEEKCDGNAKVELSYLEIYNEEINGKTTIRRLLFEHMVLSANLNLLLLHLYRSLNR